jgi:hypothetical protein
VNDSEAKNSPKTLLADPSPATPTRDFEDFSRKRKRIVVDDDLQSGPGTDEDEGNSGWLSKEAKRLRTVITRRNDKIEELEKENSVMRKQLSIMKETLGAG